MSESRRYAKLLSAVRERHFEGRHPLAVSKERLAAALANEKVFLEGDRVSIRSAAAVYEGSWVEAGQGARLEGRFLPKPSTRIQLIGLSVLLALMLLASAVSLMREGGSERYAIPGVTALVALFFMPLFIYGMGSAREGDEARIERALRVALEDLDAKMPPPQKWKDEE